MIELHAPAIAKVFKDFGLSFVLFTTLQKVREV